MYYSSYTDYLKITHDNLCSQKPQKRACPCYDPVTTLHNVDITSKNLFWHDGLQFLFFRQKPSVKSSDISLFKVSHTNIPCWQDFLSHTKISQHITLIPKESRVVCLVASAFSKSEVFSVLLLLSLFYTSLTWGNSYLTYLYIGIIQSREIDCVDRSCIT